MEFAGFYIYAYLLGPVPLAYLIGKLAKGIDLRKYGTGILGASNVADQVSELWPVPVGRFDVLVKGVSPVLIGDYPLGTDQRSAQLSLTSVLAIVGHNWSEFTRFQGGRRISVSSGVLLPLSPVLSGAFLLEFVPGWLFTRSSGIWVLVASTGLPIWALLLVRPAPFGRFCVLLLMLVMLKRILSNGDPIPQGNSRRRVLLDQLVKDRDVDIRAEWINRVPLAKNRG